MSVVNIFGGDILVDMQTKFIGQSMNRISGNFRARSGQKRIGLEMVKWEIEIAGIQPIAVPVYWVFMPFMGKGKKRWDWSNYAMTVKTIEDAFVQAGILPDDSSAYVKGGFIAAAMKTTEPVSYIRVLLISA